MAEQCSYVELRPPGKIFIVVCYNIDCWSNLTIPTYSKITHWNYPWNAEMVSSEWPRLTFHAWTEAKEVTTNQRVTRHSPRGKLPLEKTGLSSYSLSLLPSATLVLYEGACSESGNSSSFQHWAIIGQLADLDCAGRADWWRKILKTGSRYTFALYTLSAAKWALPWSFLSRRQQHRRVYSRLKSDVNIFIEDLVVQGPIFYNIY